MRAPQQRSDWPAIIALFVVGCGVVALLMQIGGGRMTFLARFLHVLVAFGTGCGAVVLSLVIGAKMGGSERTWPTVLGGVIGLLVAMPLSIALAWKVARAFDPSW